uniref:ARAD1B06798p n=1 Tax=Blastobotrys adeninivorans TaxID=409370 RepID=A0A060TBB7_BLAAD
MNAMRQGILGCKLWVEQLVLEAVSSRSGSKTLAVKLTVKVAEVAIGVAGDVEFCRPRPNGTTNAPNNRVDVELHRAIEILEMVQSHTSAYSAANRYQAP